MNSKEALKDLRDVKGWNDVEFNKRLDIIEKDLEQVNHNIEDLFDGYVVRNELVRDLDIAKAYSKTFGQPVYGAIWTNKGLIFVAELKKEGWEMIWK